ncbi:hypothetical protein AYX22_12845 [Arthrobacter sp. D5-1]|nr:hypothetical protein AYX22_12845 [Arthrobacter sp. D5-1]
MLLGLLKEGWHFVSDDTVPVTAQHCFIPFTRPVGIRQATLQRTPWLAPFMSKAKKFDTPTGITAALHPRDFGAAISSAMPAWVWTVIVESSEDFDVEKLGPCTIKISFDVRTHLAQAQEAILVLVEGRQ